MSFSIIAADPAWAFGDKLPGNGRGAEKHYDVMSWEQICQMELPPIADDAILFLWRVHAMQHEALAVMHMWGFTQKSELVWVKTKSGLLFPEENYPANNEMAFGMGRYTRACHEVCLIGVKGRGIQLVKDHSIRSVFFAPRGAHSAKPDKFFQIVDKMCPEGDRVELFARQHRPNWVCLGNELGHTFKASDPAPRADKCHSQGDSNGPQDASADQAGSGEAGSPSSVRPTRKGRKGSHPRKAGDAAAPPTEVGG